MRASPPLVALLRDGRRVVLREVRAEDEAAFGAAFSRLSADARYNRFLGAVRELPPSVLERAVNPVEGSEVALVAVCAEGEVADIVAGARYFVEGDGTSCEFAVTVAEDCRRTGLALHLMQALMAAARSRGVKSMRGYVLASNAPMLGLAQRLGFQTTASADGPSVKLVSKSLV